jgi:hypothetical protein
MRHSTPQAFLIRHLNPIGVIRFRRILYGIASIQNHLLTSFSGILANRRYLLAVPYC